MQGFLPPSVGPWLLGLLLVWAALLFGPFAFGRPPGPQDGRMPMWARLASSLTLAVAGWSWYAAAHGTINEYFALLIAAGMTLGALGDLLLSRWIGGRQQMMPGMIAFALGHVAYVAAGLLYGNFHGLAAPAPRYGTLAAGWVVGLVGWYLVARRGLRPTALHWATLAYCLLLASTAGAALGLVIQDGRLWPFALGALLFLLSDLLVAARMFRPAATQNGYGPLATDDLIWLTYGPGQMLIVYSVGVALRIMAP